MRNFSILFALAILTLTTIQAQPSIKFGTDTTFEIATWNIEHFPKKNQTTIDYVINLAEMMDIDMFALQEIEDESAFNQVVAGLPGFNGFYASYEYSGMAYLYNAEIINVTNTYKILTGYSRELPRAPFVAELTINGEDFVIINNHFKCCGDGVLDMNDNWDEEKRRLDASILLKNYIDNNLSDQKVIVLGDLNDILTDDAVNNVFMPFLDDPDNYVFADMHIAQAPSADWSYPSWPSHLDHILITNDIVSELTHEDYGASIIKPDAVMAGGFSTYDANVSDHRPVALKLAMPVNTNGINYKVENPLSIYPNPATSYINITDAEAIKQIQITDVTGTIVLQIDIHSEQSISLPIAHLNEGFYMLTAIDQSGKYTTQKVLIEAQ